MAGLLQGRRRLVVVAVVLAVTWLGLRSSGGDSGRAAVATASAAAPAARVSTDQVLGLLPDLSGLKCKASAECSAAQTSILKQSMNLAQFDPTVRHYWHLWDEDAPRRRPLYRFWEFVEPVSQPRWEEPHDKWIVITSIAPPTEDIRAWTKLQDWKIVVVGDDKSPPVWKMEGVTFLSMDDQHKMPFKLPLVMPHRAYARKAVGYLYAMWHGARVIFETDDDNAPKEGVGLSWIKGESVPAAGIKRAGPGVSNVYAHFGQCTLWPRGYPMSEFLQHGAHHCFQSTYQDQPQDTIHIPIQQGLADLDPDVDAIWRLSRTDEIGTIKFDPGAADLAYGRGSFSPYNCQNTAHYKSAFWALFLPPGAHLRVTDIWRSYWAQRLMWDVGGAVNFVSGTVNQVRNPHSFEEDYADELRMYIHAAPLVDYLERWSCDHGHLFDCMLQLSFDLIDEGYWAPLDGQVMEAWVSDLAAMGYVPPPLAAKPRAA